MLSRLPYDVKNGMAIMAMWRNWALSLGALGVVVIMSLFVSAHWLPLLSLLLLTLFWVRTRFADEEGDSLPVVWIMPVMITKVLVWTTTIMFVLSFLWLHSQWGWLPGEANSRHPYLPILVIAPVVTVFAGHAMLRGYRHSFFLDVKRRVGSLAEQGYLGSVLMQEARFQVKFTFWLNLFMTVVCTAFYFIFYINVNLNKLDKFVFVWMPLTLYLVAVVYMGIRYFTIAMYYSHESGNRMGGNGSSTVRYIIVDNEHFYLGGEDNLGDGSATNQRPQLDTPAILSFPYRERVTRPDALKYFEELSHVGPDGAAIRFMYLSHTAIGRHNVFHYIATVNSHEPLEQGPLKGKWYNLAQIHRLMANQRLNPMLAAELDRLFTVTLAWKTYDREGRRLYKIKNYKPTFRLADIQNWDVDFNDPKWLEVAENNADRPFFTVRRIWKRLVHRQ